VPEIVDQGVTGFVVRSIGEAVAAVQRMTPSTGRASARRSPALSVATMSRTTLGSIPGCADPRPRTGKAAIGPKTSPRTTMERYALNCNEFLVADALGDITGEGDGLFYNDTRLLSRFSLTVGGRRHRC
jgi:hypothetical protein